MRFSTRSVGPGVVVFAAAALRAPFFRGVARLGSVGDRGKVSTQGELGWGNAYTRPTGGLPLVQSL